MKKLLALFLSTFMIIILTSCGSEKESNSKEEFETGKNEVKINLAYNGTQLSKKYDLKIKVDDNEFTTMTFGEKEKLIEFKLDDGDYTLNVERIDSSDIKGSVELSISEDTNLSYELLCLNDTIQIEEITEINPPISASEVKGRTFNEISRLFKKAGFTKIGKREIKDLTLEEKDEEFLVTSIKINDSEFTKGNKYYCNSKVEIEYHKQKDIEMLKSSASMIGQDYEEVKDSLESLGFNNIVPQVYKGSKSSNKSIYTVTNVSANGRGFNKGDSFDSDAEVIIEYYLGEEEITSNYEDDLE